ncbi:MAG: iron donor protein CyaY [Armatimonadetes bacterium]|nr:iron donor protein CyaY [Armatimonadota bacterium]
MTDKEYHDLSQETLKRIARAFDDEDPDEVEAETIPGVVTLIFGDGKRFILNRQPAVQQLWLAAGASAWHFKYDLERISWQGDKGEGDLYDVLTRVVTDKLGRPITL